MPNAHITTDPQAEIAVYLRGDLLITNQNFENFLALVIIVIATTALFPPTFIKFQYSFSNDACDKIPEGESRAGRNIS